MELNELIACGKELGLEGAALKKWVDHERAQDRATKAQEQEQAREAELRSLELKIKLQELQNAAPPGTGENGTASALVKSPQRWLPTFDEKKDDLDAYLSRFERLATGQLWPQEQWATALSVCLSGEALAVFARLTPEDSLEYEKVKKALLQRFRLTADGFRDKFRGARPEKGETGTQYAARLSSLFDRWIGLSGTEKEFSALRNLLLTEQFVRSVSPKMSLFLRERKGRALEDIASLADRYLEAQEQEPVRHEDTGGGPSQNASHLKPNGKRNENNRSPGKCFLCGKSGHLAAECRSGMNQNRKAVVCQNCGKTGHAANKCWSPVGGARVSCLHAAGEEMNAASDRVRNGYVELRDGTKVPVVNAMSAAALLTGDMPVAAGRLQGQAVTVLRDTGCNTVVVRRDLVSDESLTGRSSLVYLVDGTAKVLPEAKVHVQTPFYSGTITAKCMDSPLYDVILGNIPNVRAPGDPDVDWNRSDETKNRAPDDKPENTGVSTTAAVETRSRKKMAGKGVSPLRVPSIEGAPAGPEELATQQKEDPSLKTCFVRVGKEMTCKNSNDRYEFAMHEGLLYRIFRPAVEREVHQLVLPQGLRDVVLRMAHDGILAGHQGAEKTTHRVLEEFYWPGLQADVKRFVRSCDQCQRTTPKGKVTKAPLGTMPLIDTPFQRVAVDIVGPITPVTAKGNRYILTLVDYATRYPDAVALPDITTERVAEGLVEMFTRIGLPKEIVSDRGSNFTSDVMKEVSRLLSMTQLHTTPYHPMANGLVEKFNGTIKMMMRRMCQERPRDWDRYLAPLLFAYREVPQASLGFSPFELLYGRHVRGPLSVLKELWTNEALEPEIRTTYEYVCELRNRLEATCRLAHEELERSGARYKKYYDKKARNRALSAGDRVLILLPTDNNKLLMQWRGPYPVMARKGEVDYAVDIGHATRLFHINMLKKYEERDPTTASGEGIQCALVTPDEGEWEDRLPLLRIERVEDSRDVAMADGLTERQRRQAQTLVKEFEVVFSDVPGRTDLVECRLDISAPRPVHTKQYPLPHAVRHTINDEVQKMWEMGIIERSHSAYNSPVLAVKKSDGTHRLCIDFRALNDVLDTDAEPIPRVDTLFSEIGAKKYFSKLDFTKGYWQIPLSEESRAKTAFSTDTGLYQFRFMPFGIKTAPAIFTRLMRRLLGAVPGVLYYYDDVLIASNTWEEHLATLREVLEKIRAAGLTVRPTKCEIGREEIAFLGHQIGKGKMAPLSGLVEKIQGAKRPETKRQVRSFLGLAGYYREFIANYAEVAAPLTGLTRKGGSNRVDWKPEHEESFGELKRRLASAPILRLPDIQKPFVLRTDASDQSIGAVLLQAHDGVLHPVAYASRRLLQREVAYATVEREGLALIWGIQKFHTYLYGRPFVLETDHQPLLYINRTRHSNARVMRWSLRLQEYDFRVRYIKGSENVGADYLSRL